MTVEHFRRIYAEEPARYDSLVAHEDHRGKLLPAIEDIAPLAGQTVVEFGAGTGRLTRLLSLRAQRVLAADISSAMLRVATERLRDSGAENWRVFAADHRCLPLPANCADLAVAGWSFGFFVDEKPEGWLPAVRAALAEAERVTRPGGALLIFETLGTGQRRPAPPNEALAAYYSWLEGERGFQRHWLRTDYQFANAAEAVAQIRFFFGAELADEVAARDAAIVPECTGLWWRRW